MIPTSYTNTTFADYLKDEVLLDTAIELGWLDTNYNPDWGVRAIDYAATVIYNPISYPFTVFSGTVNAPRDLTRLYGDGYVVLTATGSGTVTRGIDASLYNIPTGTKLTFTTATGIADGSNTYTTAADVEVGDTSITFTVTNSSTTGHYGWFYNDTYLDRVVNPIYESIIDSTLILLGHTDITAISGLDEIQKLRILGRRESWKFAMQALAADYNYLTPIGAATRDEVYAHCKNVYEIEDLRVRSIYGDSISPVVRQSAYSANSVINKVKVRW